MPNFHFKLRTLLGRLYTEEVTRVALGRLKHQVRSGPFAGMEYIARSNGSTLIPKLLGTYELEIRPFLGRILRAGYKNIIDVGCAEGYYAVGLALKLPDAKVYAYDTDPTALDNMRTLAQLNGIQDRVTAGSLLTHVELDSLPAHSSLIFCDIEGAERDLLDPARAQSLKLRDILVEIHDGPDATAIHDTLVERFKSTHQLDFIRASARTLDDVVGLEFLGHRRNRLLAVDEQRSKGLEWGYFVRSAAKSQR